jgi:excisionase family DNA binding protein
VEGQKLLKPREVAKRLGIAMTTLYMLTHKGEIPAMWVGKRLRYEEKAIADYLRKNRVKAKPLADL